jgi:hypothetical protein
MTKTNYKETYVVQIDGEKLPSAYVIFDKYSNNYIGFKTNKGLKEVWATRRAAKQAIAFHTGKKFEEIPEFELIKLT